MDLLSHSKKPDLFISIGTDSLITLDENEDSEIEETKPEIERSHNRNKKEILNPDNNILLLNNNENKSVMTEISPIMIEEEEEMKALTWKIDLRLIPFLSILYFFSFLDRVNVGNVHVPMNEDLKLSESQYGIVVGIFFLGYILFELPSNLLMKRATPSRWLARIMFIWGIICVCMAFAQSFTSLV